MYLHISKYSLNKMNKSKSCFSRKINKIDKALIRHYEKERRERKHKLLISELK